MRCFRCAVEIVVLPEGDPRRGSERVHYTPAFVLEVIGGGPAGGGPCRAAVVCWTCFHEIDPDMWEAGDYWDARSPAVPFAQLPPLDHDNDEHDECWTPETYAAWAPKEGR